MKTATAKKFLKWTVYLPFMGMVMFLGFFSIYLFMALEVYFSKDWFALSIIAVLALSLLYGTFLMLFFFIMSLVLSFEVKENKLAISFIKVKCRPPFFKRYHINIPISNIIQIEIAISKTMSIDLFFYSETADIVSNNAREDYQVKQWRKIYPSEIFIREIEVNALGLTKIEYANLKNIINLIVAENGNIKLKIHEGLKTTIGHW